MEQIRPGPHTYDGSLTQLDIQWEELDARIRSAHIDSDLVILIEPNVIPKNRIKVIIESGILWNGVYMAQGVGFPKNIWTPRKRKYQHTQIKWL
mgnify:CR=1 FL=1